MSAEQLEMLGDARRKAKKIVRAAGIATGSGWTMAAIAAVCILAGVFDVRSLVLGLALAAIAAIELRAARRLRTFDVTAARQLGCNQLGLIGVVTVYAVWSLVATLTGPGPYDEHLAAGGPLADTLGPIDRLTTTVTVCFYVLLVIAAAMMQGGLSAYYFTRSTLVKDYVQRTPEWVVGALRAAA